MKRILVGLLMMLLLENCFNKHEVIESKGPVEIIVTINPLVQSSDSIKVVIKGNDSIATILQALNDCQKEPIKFYPTHRLRIIYSNGSENLIFCNASAMKYNGLTYKLDKSIEDIIKN